MFYKLKVRFLKTSFGSSVWKWRMKKTGKEIGNYACLPDYVKQSVRPGDSFVDIGCMWGVNGEFAFLAEKCGATWVKGVDVFGPTPDFESKKRQLNSNVEFILGDIADSSTLKVIGINDVVFCAGVLYHHPSPFDLLVALRKVCKRTLILRTSTIPEISGLPNAAIFYPMLKSSDRQLWNLSNLGLLKQVGITDQFEPNEGYGNWFWGLTPSSIEALLKIAGFEVELNYTEPFAQTYICKVVAVPFEHNLPDASRAKEMGEVISATQIAHPA